MTLTASSAERDFTDEKSSDINEYNFLIFYNAIILTLRRSSLFIEPIFSKWSMHDATKSWVKKKSIQILRSTSRF